MLIDVMETAELLGAENDLAGDVKAIEVYAGSDGALTRAYYAALEQRGLAGVLAANLFRASKNSARAKQYRGGTGRQSYRSMAYSRKEWAIENLGKTLVKHVAALGVEWGWASDPEQELHCWVLYVDLPQGQVSFHTASRGPGPDYGRGWDGMRMSQPRILEFCDGIMSRPV